MPVRVAVFLVFLAGAAWAGGDLAAPVRLDAGGSPIAVEVGHAAPFVCDLDRDGRPDLLVGQMGGGKLRLFRNAGSSPGPTYEPAAPVRAGDAEATVPSG